jgi:predicted amidohydrolase
MKDIRIAAVISRAPVGAIRENLDRMENWIGKARQSGAHIICFPELNLSGYDVSSDIREAAEKISGKTVFRLLAMARREQIAILAGMAEMDEDNRVYASHLAIGSDGMLGVYRKLHIAPPEKHLFSPGNDIPLFTAHGATFGIQLCYDAHFPEISTRMALGGADIIFIPHASPRGTPRTKLTSWKRHLPARAYDNSVFVVACNQTGDNGKGLSFPGIALAIGPGGQILDQTLSEDEDMLLVELKENDMRLVRENRMHYFLPHRRADLF